MNFFLTILSLCIFLNEYEQITLKKCHECYPNVYSDETLFYGYECTDLTYNFSNNFVCINGTSAVLRWEIDIFEIGFRGMNSLRPKEVVIKIDLNNYYYIEIKVISDKKNKNVAIILNECSHENETCLENRNETHHVEYDFEAYVAIGFRKDKKMNFVSVSDFQNLSTNLFGPKNEYEFKMPGFYFNTNETMNITVYSPFDRNYEYDGLVMILPTSTGGFFFIENGFLIHDNDSACERYNNPNESEGLPYIIKEYFNNSENWKDVFDSESFPKFYVPYFYSSTKSDYRKHLFLYEVPNPDFDEKKMIRKGCKYVEKTDIDTTPKLTEKSTILKEESTLTEDGSTKETTKLMEKPTLTEDKVTKKTKPGDVRQISKNNSVSSPMPQFLGKENRQITIGKETLNLPGDKYLHLNKME
ncbi:UNVERIFIED_CONTAM: hypothetical protein RMT77_013882 [Armadillidium vulgare]